MLADALLQYETLDADDVKAILEGQPQVVRNKMTAKVKEAPKQDAAAASGGKSAPVETDGASIPGAGAKGRGEIF